MGWWWLIRMITMWWRGGVRLPVPGHGEPLGDGVRPAANTAFNAGAWPSSSRVSRPFQSVICSRSIWYRRARNRKKQAVASSAGTGWTGGREDASPAVSLLFDSPRLWPRRLAGPATRVSALEVHVDENSRVRFRC